MLAICVLGVAEVGFPEVSTDTTPPGSPNRRGRGRVGCPVWCLC